MNNAPPAASGVPSPCIDVCRMDPASGWCEGCLRSLEEIAAWSQLDDAAKGAIWLRLAARREQIARRAHEPRVQRGAKP